MSPFRLCLAECIRGIAPLSLDIFPVVDPWNKHHRRVRTGGREHIQPFTRGRHMAWFGGKDWNIIAVIFERPDLYRVNGQRGKGGDATTIRDAVKKHPRTIFWGAFDQKGGYLEGGPADGSKSISTSALQRLVREIAANPSVREVLATLETGKESKISKPLV